MGYFRSYSHSSMGKSKASDGYCFSQIFTRFKRKQQRGGAPLRGAGGVWRGKVTSEGGKRMAGINNVK